MKSVTLYCMILMLICVGCQRDGNINSLDSQGAKNGLWITKHKNGQPHSRGEYVNGRENGYWQYYYNNGQLSRVGTYELGYKKGTWTYFAYSGDFNRCVNFNHDEYDGPMLTVAADGSVAVRNYKNGRKDGAWVDLLSDGALQGLSHWRTGMQHGGELSFKAGCLDRYQEFQLGTETGLSLFAPRDHLLRYAWLRYKDAKREKFFRIFQ